MAAHSLTAGVCVCRRASWPSRTRLVSLGGGGGGSLTALSLSYPFSLGRDIQVHGWRAAAGAQTPQRTECQEVMKVDMSETGNSL